MSYEVFQRKVNALVAKANQGITNPNECTKVRFHHDEETGKHYANCSNGTTIIGNSVSPRMAVKWGSGHMAYA